MLNVSDYLISKGLPVPKTTQRGPLHVCPHLLDHEDNEEPCYYWNMGRDKVLEHLKHHQKPVPKKFKVHCILCSYNDENEKKLGLHYYYNHHVSNRFAIAFDNGVSPVELLRTDIVHINAEHLPEGSNDGWCKLCHQFVRVIALIELKLTLSENFVNPSDEHCWELMLVDACYLQQLLLAIVDQLKS